jgi:hypothetical protein
MIRAYVSDKGQVSSPVMMEIHEAFLKHKSHEIEIEIKRLKRTSQQNRTLHWGLGIFANGLTEKGYKIKMEDLKYELKQRGFFGWVEYETKEGTKRRPKDTHEMTTDECADAFEKLQTSAASYDIIIPNPDPNL